MKLVSLIRMEGFCAPAGAQNPSILIKYVRRRRTENVTL